MARVHVSLDDDAVDAIDLLVGARGRRRFLKEAAREKLDRIDVGAAVRNGPGMLRDDDYPAGGAAVGSRRASLTAIADDSLGTRTRGARFRA